MGVGRRDGFMFFCSRIYKSENLKFWVTIALYSLFNRIYLNLKKQTCLSMTKDNANKIKEGEIQ